MDSKAMCELKKLLNEIRSGAEADAAFSELEARYKPLMKRCVSAYFGTDDDSSEAFQEARIALHNAAMSYEADRFNGVTFGLYADVCICNRLKSQLRSDRKRNERSESLEEAERELAVGGLEETVVAKDLCERVMRVAAGILSDFEYEVFRMSYERYSTSDIAKALMKPPKSIDNAKYRISRRLRENKDICDILLDIK